MYASLIGGLWAKYWDGFQNQHSIPNKFNFHICDPDFYYFLYITYCQCQLFDDCLKRNQHKKCDILQYDM